MFRILSASQDASLTDRLIAAMDGVATVIRADPSLRALEDAAATVRPDLIALDIDDTIEAVDRSLDDDGTRVVVGAAREPAGID